MSLLITLIYIIFVLSAIVLVTVVLLQEGKGGGFGEALGTSGQQTFGVGASGINKFTGIVAAVFLGSALLTHVFNRAQSGSSVIEQVGDSVLDSTVSPVAPPEGGTPAVPPTDGK